MSTYRTLDGAELSLDGLAPAEKGCLTQLLLAYAQNTGFAEFTATMYAPGNPVLSGRRLVTPEVASSVLYQIAEDLRFRLGIRQGRVGPDPGDDVTAEPLSPDDWLPVAEAAKLRNVSVVAIHKAIKTGKLVARNPEGERGVWVSKTSVEGYVPSEGKRRAGQIARGKEAPSGEGPAKPSDE